MGDLVWEWTLPSGEALIARLDPASKVESVFVGPRLAARSGAGGKPGGHAVSLSRGPSAGAGPYRGPSEALVTFDHVVSGCVARVDGKELALVRSPYSAGPSDETARSPRASSGIGTLLVIVVVFLIVAGFGGVFAVRYFRESREASLAAETTINASFRSPNGLLVARHPAAFQPSITPNMSSGTSIIALRSKTKDEAVFLASFILPGPPPRDIWRIHELIQKDFSKGLAPDGGTYTEEERQDGKCAGEDAAIVFGRIQVKGQSGRIWFCTFVHAGHAYRFTYAVADKHLADEPFLRQIVDATELLSGPAGRATLPR